ncbi:MAG: hypothetical protein LBT25_09500 [Candidatus Symbiothrix sp.]|jgi:hypothetical protein|nr:hypothetical protein [Candidatus Symbiothrix sp.]
MKYILNGLFLFLFISCQSVAEKEYFEGTNVVKLEKIYSAKDKSAYTLITYFDNGRIKETGQIIDNKKEGIWKEWYADGMLRREIEYENGEVNIFNENRQLPILIFSSDSLITGVQTFIKFTYSYPSDGLACNNGIIMGLEDKSNYDFVIIPSEADSMRFYYDCVWCQPEKADTIIVPVSEITDLSEYGLTEDDVKDRSSVTIISGNVKSIILGTFPIYNLPCSSTFSY